MGAWDPGVIASLTQDTKPLPDLGYFPFPAVPGGQGEPGAIMGGADGYSCSVKAPKECSDFLNYLLTKDVQTRIMAAVKLNSRRKDVPPGFPEGQIDWSRYKDYISGQSEDLTEAMSEFKKLARNILK